MVLTSIMDESLKYCSIYYDHDYTSRQLIPVPESLLQNKFGFDCSSVLKLFKCKFCRYETFFRVLVTRHINKRHKRRKWDGIHRVDVDLLESDSHVCSQCDFSTFSTLILMKHVCSGLKNIRYKCCTCSFTVLAELKYISIQRNQKLFECDQCKFATEFYEQVLMHRSMQHSGSKSILLNHFLLEHRLELTANASEINLNQISLTLLPQLRKPAEPLDCKFFCKYLDTVVQKAERYFSDQCVFSAWSKRELRQHVRRGSEIVMKVVYNCSLCPFTVSAPLKIAPPKNPQVLIKCTQCPSKVGSFHELFIHKSVRHATCKPILLKHLDQKHINNYSFIGNHLNVKFRLQKGSFSDSLHFTFFGVYSRTSYCPSMVVEKSFLRKHVNGVKSRIFLRDVDKQAVEKQNEYICTYCKSNDRKAFFNITALKHHLNFVHLIGPVLPKSTLRHIEKQSQSSKRRIAVR